MASDMVKYYVYATIAMYGFFSVGMISDAKLFYGADSPMCYWTSFDVSGQWFAKSAGTVMFFTLMSPFFAGVSYETFVRMTLPANIFNLGLFIQGGLFLSTTGPDGCSNSMAPINLWIPQIGMGVAFTIWNLLAYKEEATGGPIVQASKDGATYFCWAMAIVYAATFGSTLIIAPKFFWGPDSLFCYWEVNDESGVTFGRMLGCLMCMLYLAPFYAGLDYSKLAKITLPLNIFFLSYFCKCAFFIGKTGPGPNALLPLNLWVLQVPIGLGFLIWNIKVLQETKGSTLLF